MHQIRYSIFTAGLAIVTYLIIGCKTDIDINHHIDKSIPLKLTITTKDTTDGHFEKSYFEIPVGSIKYKKLLAWCDTNANGWTSTPASYFPDIFVGQNDFRLLTLFDGHSVVVGFNDDNNRARQYVKSVKDGSLDFLKE